MLLVFALANGDAQRAVLNGAVDGDREIERILKFEIELDGAARGAASSDGGVYAVRGICRAAGAVRVAIDDGNALRELKQGVIKRRGNLTGAAARARDGFAVDQHGGILVAAALAILFDPLSYMIAERTHGSAPHFLMAQLYQTFGSSSIISFAM